MAEQADHEPDYRFTLANERTFLAWLRTALALVAAAVAVVHLFPGLGFDGSRRLVGALLAAVGTVVAVAAVFRWRTVQAAMRRGSDLPATRMPVLLSGILTVLTVAVLALLLAGATPG